MGASVLELGLEPVTGRGDRSLPVEECDGTFKVAAIVAEFVTGQGVKRMFRLCDRRFGGHRWPLLTGISGW
jgi:hypothetical protein